MNRKDQETLYKLLKIWFNENDFDRKNFLNRNKIAKLICSEITKAGRWKKKVDKTMGGRLNPFKFS